MIHIEIYVQEHYYLKLLPDRRNECFRVLVHSNVAKYILNVIFQHPVALCRSDLRISTQSICKVVRFSFIRHYFTTCFGLNEQQSPEIQQTVHLKMAT
jgi:hypothetical protein